MIIGLVKSLALVALGTADDPHDEGDHSSETYQYGNYGSDAHATLRLVALVLDHLSRGVYVAHVQGRTASIFTH
jgi:hypothetical protein